MKKLKLELDALKVESFNTGASRNPGGTVRGHLWMQPWELPQEEEEVALPPESRWSCPLGCTDGCTAYSCASGGPVCCA